MTTSLGVLIEASQPLHNKRLFSGGYQKNVAFMPIKADEEIYPHSNKSVYFYLIEFNDIRHRSNEFLQTGKDPLLFEAILEEGVEEERSET